MASQEHTAWTLGPDNGELTVHTGVAGRAARMGHRLTIAVTRWRAGVNWVGGQPDTAELVVEVDSLEVTGGVGGLKGLSGPEQVIARTNALKSLSANRFPEIRFAADTIEQTDGGYRLAGTLFVRGKSREHVVELRVEDLGDTYRLGAESRVRQTDYGIKPYAMFLGSLQVADEVTVSFHAVRQKPE